LSLDSDSDNDNDRDNDNHEGAQQRFQERFP
jgi:hypothetical protein